MPIFLNVFDQDSSSGAKTEFYSMAEWSFAGLQKRRMEKWPLDFPTLSVSISNDDWNVWVAVARETEGEAESTRSDEERVEMYLFGPLLIGSMRDSYSAIVLMANLADLALWGTTEYKAWFEEHVLKAKLEAE